MGVDPEVLAAERSDSVIEAVLGRGGSTGDRETERIVAHLAVMLAAPPPPGLSDRVRARLDRSAATSRRSSVLVRALAAALGFALVVPASIQVLAGERLARYLKLTYEPHFYREYGIVLIVLGVGLLAGAWKPSWLGPGVAFGPPVALALGVFAMTEIPHAPNPSAELLHFGQATLGAALLCAWLWWRKRR